MDSNTLLKEKYLAFWLSMNRETPNVKVHMAENTIVTGIYKGTDAENNRFRIDQLQTPMGIHDRSVLRGGDIDMMEFKL
ncbi:hypothetical protein BJ944DRAFT_268501 [Cunninghamella echinulata]|nr:hypothetical protein BJ944DRAFT_268501 [Cunninghamella echinulata]